jgi:peptidoglycan/LPS O-acetylase OafA/YrhL
VLAVGLLVCAGAYLAFLTRVLHGDTIGSQMRLGLSLVGRSPTFLAGIFAAWLYLHHGHRVRALTARHAWVGRGAADLVLLAILCSLGLLLRWVVWIGPQDELNPPYHAWHVPEAALWAGVLLLLVLAPLRTKPLLVNRALDRLGVLSYSMYILHVPIFAFGLRLLPLTSWGWNARAIGIAAVLCAVCVACAEMTYRGIERPFLRRKEHLAT